MKWRTLALALALITGFTPVENASAIYKGTSALGSPYVVQVTSPIGWCSGILVQPQILATAAHCVVDSAGQPVSASTVGIYSPGVDTSKNRIVSKGYQIFFPTGYASNPTETRPNDIAFIALDQAVNSNVTIKLANYEKTQSLISKGAIFLQFGYGNISLGVRTSIPQQIIARPTTQKNYRSYGGYQRTYIDYLSDESGSSCPGDSGGPVIAESDGITYLVSIHNGASGPCSSPSSPSWGSMGSIAGEYENLFDSASTLIAKIKPTEVTNVKITSTALNGNITWDIPTNSPVPPTGYLVKDAGSNEICRTTSNSCQVVLKLGSNAFTVFTVAGNILSNGVSTEFLVNNATNPEFLELVTYQTQVGVKWAAINNFGGATPAATFIEVRDDANNELLCSAPSNDYECRFSRAERTYNLSLNIKSNLGQTSPTRIGTYLGITQSSLVIRTEMIAKDLSLQLKSSLIENPGYAAEIEVLSSSIPNISADFVFKEEILTQLVITRTKVSTLISRMMSKPRKISISCAKGKQKKSLTAVKPICPPGFKKIG
jgi:hypothetical protein